MPKPGPCGILSKPFCGMIGSRSSSVLKGFSVVSYSKIGSIGLADIEAGGIVAMRCKFAAKATPLPQTCGRYHAPGARHSGDLFALGKSAGGTCIRLHRYPPPAWTKAPEAKARILALSSGNRIERASLTSI